MKARVLFISHVNPTNPRSGQQQRVFYSIKAAKKYFHITFLTLAQKDEDIKHLTELCDEVLVLPSILSDYKQKLLYALPSIGYILRTGLKKSNFAIGEVEFSPRRLTDILEGSYFDFVIFEYWHAYKAAEIFRERGVPCILDMHDILWKAFEQQIKTKAFPTFYKERIGRLYRNYEQKAWQSFDRIISINKIEQDIVKDVVPSKIDVDFLPMGVDISKWEYLWKYDTEPPARIGFYGGLSSKVNVNSALRCLDKIMPIIWESKPETELWLIGNNPADILRQKANEDSRIIVTGYIEQVQQTIAEMGVVLCPWDGVFGFRSRIIEVMAVGTPLVVSDDAIAGMGIVDGAIKIGRNDAELAEYTLDTLANKDNAQYMSLIARKDVEKNYSYEGSYLKYFKKLSELFTDEKNI